MKRTLFVFGGFLFCTWVSVQLWLAGYQSGFEEGSVSAWHQAHEVLSPSAVSLSSRINGNDHNLDWNPAGRPAQLVEITD